MSELPKLNFPPIRPRARRRGREIDVWDSLRGMWLVLTPEEWVRQHLIGWIEAQGVPPRQIVQEWPVNLNGQPQRADVVVVDRQGKPQLLAECKAAGVKIDDAVLAQAVRYNSVVGAPRILLTNGRTHYLYRRTPTGYEVLRELPESLF